MSEREETAVRLARVLEEAGLAELAARARAYDYDDYRSEATDFPQMLLVQHLRLVGGHEDLVQRVIDGEFDGQGWEARAWAASEEGQETMRQLGGRGAFGQPL